MFPSLDNISFKGFAGYKDQHDTRLNKIDKKMDSFEVSTKRSVEKSVSEMKGEIIDSIKDDIDRLVDMRNKKL